MLQILKFLKELLKPSSSKEKAQKIKLSSLKRLSPYLKTRWKQGVVASLFMIIVSLLALPTPNLTISYFNIFQYHSLAVANY